MESASFRRAKPDASWVSSEGIDQRCKDTTKAHCASGGNHSQLGVTVWNVGDIFLGRHVGQFTNDQFEREQATSVSIVSCPVKQTLTID